MSSALIRLPTDEEQLVISTSYSHLIFKRGLWLMDKPDLTFYVKEHKVGDPYVFGNAFVFATHLGSGTNCHRFYISSQENVYYLTSYDWRCLEDSPLTWPKTDGSVAHVTGFL